MVQAKNASELRGFWLPLSGTYAIGYVRLEIERALTLPGPAPAAVALPAVVWQADQLIACPWRQADGKIYDAVESSPGVPEDYRRPRALSDWPTLRLRILCDVEFDLAVVVDGERDQVGPTTDRTVSVNVCRRPPLDRRILFSAAERAIAHALSLPAISRRRRLTRCATCSTLASCAPPVREARQNAALSTR
jgi:hypothetical protein